MTTATEPTQPENEVAARIPANPGFRGDIDGLRAIAILLVVAFHIKLPGFSGGFIGVDIFFVISGYLITRNLIVEADASGSVRLWNFWARRIRRLVPALALVVLSTLAASYFILPSIDFPSISRQGAASALYVSNVLFATESQDYFGEDVAHSPYLQTWSLGVEEQFYIIWPLVIGGMALLFARRRKERFRSTLIGAFAVTLIGSLALSITLTNSGSAWAFYGLPSRAWQFAAAGLLATVTVPRHLSRPRVQAVAAVVGLTLIVLATATLSQQAYPGLFALLPVIGAVTLIFAGQPQDEGAGSTPIARFLALPPLQWLGRVSYSWYLWHWPFIIFAAELFGDSRPWLAIAAGLSLPVAYAAYRMIENPIRFNEALSRSVGRTLVFGVSVTVATVVLCTAAVRLSTAPAGSLDDQLAQARDDPRAYPCKRELTSPTGVEYCEDGYLEGETTIMLVGDSHARHWKAALAASAESLQVRLIDRWLPSCPAIPVQLRTQQSTQQKWDECLTGREETNRLIDELQPDAVILSEGNFYLKRITRDGSRPPLDEQVEIWGEAFEAFLADLRAKGIQPAVIYDNPTLPHDPIACVARSRVIASCEVSREEATVKSEVIQNAESEVIDRIGDVPTFSVTDTICDDTTCKIHLDGYFVYVDPGHLSREFTTAQHLQLDEFLRQILGD